MKKIAISLLSIIFIISMITNVYAATGTISSGASTDTVIKGKTFTVTIAGTADSPIDGMYTKFNYDKNILSLESATAGENYGNNSSDGEILISNNSSSTSANSATLYTMTFKVLDNTSATNTTISFSDSELHLNVDGTVNNVSTSIATVTVTIKTDDTTAGGQDNSADKQNPSNDNNASSGNNNNNSNSANKGENKSENTNKDVNTNKNTNTNTNKNTTKKLPQTGVESTTLFAIIALAVVGITSFISYRKYKNI